MIVQQDIQRELGEAFDPLHMEVINESHMHSVPPKSETHFKVLLVSEVFESQRKVARHQAVYGVLAEQLEGPVHALALHLYTPQEWQQRAQEVPISPDCKGGSKREVQ